MIAWRPQFPWYSKPMGYLRLLRARHRFYDTFTLSLGGPLGIRITRRKGYQRAMWAWRNRFAGRRCFVIGNGPSLEKMDIGPLKNEITIGSNGLYKKFAEWGFASKYLVFEDLDQTELRGPELHRVKEPIKLAAIHNGYCVRADARTFFFHARYGNEQYWQEMAPRFSEDFADIVYLGSTVTYIALQLAYYLGCEPVYLIGVDHNYGELPKLFPPGKVEVTEENYHLVQQCHFDKNYYKIGDKIGVPDVEKQEKAYAKAREVFERHGRHIYNAGVDSMLDVFERCDYSTLFGKRAGAPEKPERSTANPA